MGMVAIQVYVRSLGSRANRRIYCLWLPCTRMRDRFINGVMLGLDWFPTFAAAAGYDGDIAADLRKGKKLNGKEYKVHLDGYDQTAMLTEGGKSARNALWYFAESTLASARIGDYKYVFIDQPDGWFGPKVHMDWPGIYNLRLDPFEKMNIGESMYAGNWWTYEFWRFVFVQQQVAVLAKTAIDFPPMQPGASFNLDAVKQKVEKAIASRTGQ